MGAVSYYIELICNNCNYEMKIEKNRYKCTNCDKTYKFHKNICLVDGKLKKIGYQNQNFTMTTKEHFWYRYRQNQIFDIIKKNFRKIPKVKLLDMGCGDGNVVEYLKTKGISDIAGCDISIDSITTSKLDIQLIQSNITKNIIKNDQFDVVLLLDVVEHIKDDLSLIKSAKSLLKTNGIMILTVPSPDYFYSDYDKYAGHYRRYSKKSLRKLLNKTEMNISKMIYFNSLILPAILARITYYRLIKVSKDQVEEQNLNLNPLLNVALWNISLIEKFILKYANLLIGSSILAVCRK